MKIGIIGFGTIGGGVGGILAQEQKLQKNIEVVQIATRKISSTDRKGYPKEIFTENFRDILKNPEIDTVVETLGGITIAKEVVETALQNGKNIVTANKALLAEYGNELFNLAEHQGKKILFEASVAGGIPIIETISKYISFGEISEISGIVNGTCNYMCSQMEEKEIGYQESLQKAQELGFAESDPTFDVEGMDAAQKLVILASLCFKTQIFDWKKVSRKGISHLTTKDFQQAKEDGNTIRLIASAKKNKDSGEISFSVSPQVVAQESKFGSTLGAENIVIINHSYLGKFSSSGQGAGSFPTAHAVVADLLSLT